jgi:hypothetical protein
MSTGAKILLLHAHKAIDHQAGPHEQHQRQCNLHGDQRTAKPLAHDDIGAAASGFF